MGNLLAANLTEVLENLLTNFIGTLTGFLADILFAIVKVALVLVIGVLKGVFSVIGYTISIFILSLIDFVEIIFRLLAGLEVEGGMRLTIGGGTSDGSSDLLIQLIRNDAIQQAFLAMCIVGIFLLVLTTIFQMIKVEYTTEGAKNAKGPILEKAFKGLANLMLIPILCIFGVFIGNEILGLIDTATKGTGKSPTIGGALFVAAAGDARYKEGQLRCVVSADIIAAGAGIGAAAGSVAGGVGALPGAAIGTSAALIWPVLYCIGDTYVEFYKMSPEGEDLVFDEAETNPYAADPLDVMTYDQIDNNFINCENGYHYASMANVTNYYNMFRINYLLLIVGGCICIKCLYNVCFGMILRLYYCTALFILSPVVIGMSPVTDNMGKWRTAFIGKAISAYGVVISMNLFFTIISVLLSIDLQFDNWLQQAGAFGLDMAQYLIKGIMVMGGCLMIEKWSKEFGAYFGAEDALSSGASFAKETADLTKKAVTTAVVATAAVAAGVMTAGAGTGAVAGIAGKIGMLGSKAGAAMGKAGTALAGKGGMGKVAGKALQGMGKGADKIGQLGTNAQKWVAKTEFGKAHYVNEEVMAIGDKKQGRLTNLTEDLEKKKKTLDYAIKSKDQGRIDKAKANYDDVYAKKEKAESSYGTWLESKDGKEYIRSSKAKDNNIAERVVARGAFVKSLTGLAKRNGLIGGVLGGFADAKKEWEGYEKEGAIGPEGEAALGVVTGERKDRAERRFYTRNKKDIDQRNQIQATVMNEAIISAMKAQTDEARRLAEKQIAAIEKMREAYDDAIKNGGKVSSGDYRGMTDTQLAERIQGLEEKLSDAGASKDGNGVWKKTVDGKIDIDIKGSDAIQNVMRMAIANSWNPKKITDELTRVFEEQGAAGNKKLLEEILKAIEKVKGAAGGGK